HRGEGKCGHEGKKQRQSPGQRKLYPPHDEACKSPRILHDHALRREEARSSRLRNLLVLDVQKILLREPRSSKALIQPLPTKPDDQDQPPVFKITSNFPYSRGARVEGRVLLSLTRSSTCTRYAQISVEPFPIRGSKPNASPEKK